MKLTPNPSPFRFSLGERGEAVAADFLIKNGYEILERNYKCALGEIDLIAKKSGRVSFIEIKTRSGSQFGEPQEAVDAKKQEKLLKLAAWYLRQKQWNDVPISFDVVAVTWRPGKTPEIRLFANAFEKKDSF